MRFYYTPDMSLWAGSKSGSEVVYKKEKNGTFSIAASSLNGRGFVLKGLTNLSLPEEIIASAFYSGWISTKPQKARIFNGYEGFPEFDCSDVTVRLWSHLLRRMLVGCENERDISLIVASYSPSNKIKAGVIDPNKAYGLRVYTIRERSLDKGDVTAFLPSFVDTTEIENFISRFKKKALFGQK